MADELDHALATYRNALLATIARSQEDAARRLALLRVPQQDILAALRQIEAASLTILAEQDAYTRDIRAFARQPRDPDHQRIMLERLAYHQKLVDTAFADLIASITEDTVRAFRQGLQRPPPVRQPQQVIAAPAPVQKHGLPLWLRHGLHLLKFLFVRVSWLAGLALGLALSWTDSDSLAVALVLSVLTVIGVALLWDWVGEHGWSALIPLSAIVVFCWAFL
jgi:hypothetical protein